MKLRIRGNTVRLRLSQSDVTKLENDGLVVEQTCFGPGAGQALTYSIETSQDVEEVCVRFEDSRVRVLVPASAAATWLRTEQVGIEVSQEVGAGVKLGLLLEKDFQCLVPRDGEEDHDGFPNPDATE